MKHLAAFLSALLLSACATQTPPPTPPVPQAGAHQALVHIYRANSAGLETHDAAFYVDDVHVADLSRNGHTWFLAPEGEHRLAQSWPVDLPLVQTLQGKAHWEAGQTYYYRLSTSSDLVETNVTVKWKFASVEADAAEPELKGLRYQAALGAAKLTAKGP